MAIYVFLGINGYNLHAPEDEAVKIILGISSGETNETSLSSWIRDNTTKSS
jgi:death-on-curing protein